MAYTGTLIEDLTATAARIVGPSQNPQDAGRAEDIGAELRENSKRWAQVYFETGELIIPAWALLIQIRQRLCDGAANDGVMSPGAADAWCTTLKDLQDEFVMAD